jgi:hypothetical protein
MQTTTANQLANVHARRILVIREDLANIAVAIAEGTPTRPVSTELRDYAAQLLYIADNLDASDPS